MKNLRKRNLPSLEKKSSQPSLLVYRSVHGLCLLSTEGLEKPSELAKVCSRSHKVRGMLLLKMNLSGFSADVFGGQVSVFSHL